MRWRPFRRSHAPGSLTDEAAARERRRMVHEQIEGRGLRDPELIRALMTVPRHTFVGSTAAPHAYEDRALGIGSGQTISQPYVVAAMTDAARPRGRAEGLRGARVLEIGTGSGYQAAVLAELGARIVTIERHDALAREAEARLRDAGYGPDVVDVRVGDGTFGAPESGPYDAILVTAASPSVPEPLVAQLSEDGGRLVIPIGERESQVLTVVERHGEEVASQRIEQVVFVPLIGEHGFAPREGGG